jgi:hypothetical protein
LTSLGKGRRRPIGGAGPGCPGERAASLIASTGPLGSQELLLGDAAVSVSASVEQDVARTQSRLARVPIEGYTHESGASSRQPSHRARRLQKVPSSEPEVVFSGTCHRG